MGSRRSERSLARHAPRCALAKCYALCADGVEVTQAVRAASDVLRREPRTPQRHLLRVLAEVCASHAAATVTLSTSISNARRLARSRRSHFGHVIGRFCVGLITIGQAPHSVGHPQEGRTSCVEQRDVTCGQCGVYFAAKKRDSLVTALHALTLAEQLLNPRRLYGHGLRACPALAVGGAQRQAPHAAHDTPHLCARLTHSSSQDAFFPKPDHEGRARACGE